MPWCKTIFVFIVLILGNSESFPNNKHEEDEFDVEPTGLYVVEDESNSTNEIYCDQCSPELCPAALGCRAGIVLDSCGCCSECGNLEGQPCDLDTRNSFYGLCGSDLQCKIDVSDLGLGEIPEPQCICKLQEAVCGSDGRTYINICQFQEVAYSSIGLSVKGSGPCRTGMLYIFYNLLIIKIFLKCENCWVEPAALV